MNHYICINGKKTSLTDEQVRGLGFPLDSTIEQLVKAVRDGNAPKLYRVHDIFRVGDLDL